jgi:prepilin-type N-terminal cleavage/methylation domain-containing protein
VNEVKNTYPGMLKNTYGFTLLELMVVLVIVGILATGVVFMFTNPSVKVKGQAFNMLANLNMARSEAVNRNKDVWVTFLPGAAAADPDGYRVWIDDWDAIISGPGSDGVYSDGGDTLIRETYFPEEVQFYDINATDGPDIKPFSPWDALDMEDAAAPENTDNDGIEFDNGTDEFVFTSIGIAEDSGSNTLDAEGYVLIYYPVSAANHATMRAAPYALVVVPGVGSINIARWNTRDSDWRTK